MTLIAKSVPHTISYSKNPIVFAWETDNYAAYNARMLMDVSIDLGAGLVTIGQLEKRPNSERQYVFDISEILDAAIIEYDVLAIADHNYLSPLKLAEKTQRSYSISVVEYFGDPEASDDTVTPISNLVVKGGLAHQFYPTVSEFFDTYLADKKYFLTWMPEKSVIHPKQLISFFLYNWSGGNWDSVKIEFECIFHDEVANTLSSIALFTDANISVPSQKILMIPTGPTSSDLAGLDASKKLLYYAVTVYNETDRISNTMVFEIDYIPRPDEKCFAYVNSLGGVDHIRTTGRIQPKIDFSAGSFEAERALVIAEGSLATYDPSVPVKNEFNMKESFGITVYSGHKTYAEVDLFRDFRLSPLKLELFVNADLKRYLPIIVDSKSVALPKTNEFPFNYEFTYKYAFDNRVYTPNHKFLI